MIDKYKDEILVLIQEKGPLGVNAIQRELNYPLSTLQKYLHRQSYFRINDDKKWDLPENVMGEVKTTSLTLVANVIENSILLLKSQLEELQLSVDNALSPINTLKRGISAQSPSVAAPSVKNHPLVDKIQSFVASLHESINNQKSNIPEEYRNLLLNVDLMRIMFKKGSDYFDSSFMPVFSGILLKETDVIPDEMLELIEHCQKEA